MKKSVAKNTTKINRSKKHCTVCGGPGPFHKLKGAKDGLHSWCKKCVLAAKRKQYEADPEKYKTKSRTNYHSRRLEDRRAYNKKKYAADPEKWKQYARNYRKKYPEKVAAAARANHSERLEVHLLQRARRRAKKQGWDFNLELADVVVPSHCPLLGIPIDRAATRAAKNGAASLDRKDSSQGYVKGNVWVVSFRANTLKSNATLEELELLTVNLRAALNQ